MRPPSTRSQTVSGPHSVPCLVRGRTPLVPPLFACEEEGADAVLHAKEEPALTGAAGAACDGMAGLAVNTTLTEVSLSSLKFGESQHQPPSKPATADDVDASALQDRQERSTVDGMPNQSQMQVCLQARVDEYLDEKATPCVRTLASPPALEHDRPVRARATPMARRHSV